MAQVIFCGPSTFPKKTDNKTKYSENKILDDFMREQLQAHGKRKQQKNQPVVEECFNWDTEFKNTWDYKKNDTFTFRQNPIDQCVQTLNKSPSQKRSEYNDNFRPFQCDQSNQPIFFENTNKSKSPEQKESISEKVVQKVVENLTSQKSVAKKFSNNINHSSSIFQKTYLPHPFEKQKHSIKKKIKKFFKSARYQPDTTLSSFYGKPIWGIYGYTNLNPASDNQYMLSHNINPQKGENHPEKQQVYKNALIQKYNYPDKEMDCRTNSVKKTRFIDRQHIEQKLISDQNLKIYDESGKSLKGPKVKFLQSNQLKENPINIPKQIYKKDKQFYVQ